MHNRVGGDLNSQRDVKDVKRKRKERKDTDLFRV
jgi:hypothetical protein